MGVKSSLMQAKVFNWADKVLAKFSVSCFKVWARSFFLDCFFEGPGSEVMNERGRNSDSKLLKGPLFIFIYLVLRINLGSV